MGKRRPASALRTRATTLRFRAPFALKLVIILVVLTVGASLWQGTRDYRLSKKRLDDIKNRGGVRFVSQLALLIPPFWWGDEHLSAGDRLEAFYRERTDGLAPFDALAFDRTLATVVRRSRRTGLAG